jgi:hypothetical protein
MKWTRKWEGHAEHLTHIVTEVANCGTAEPYTVKDMSQNMQLDYSCYLLEYEVKIKVISSVK